MPLKSKEGVTFSGAWISWVHTVVAYTAFLGALITGLYLHYHKIVENEYYVSRIPSINPPSFAKLTRCLSDIPMNGFLRTQPQLEIDILSVPSFSFS